MRNALIMILTLAALAPISGEGQNNRSAVSVTGLDTSPCTVASPCRTFNHAISQTNSGGEVIALTSGGYGPFTIDRAVSVIAPSGIYAGVTVSGYFVNGITVNAPSGANAIIRGLTLQDAGSLNKGLESNSGASLVVDHVSMDGFSVNGCIRTSIDTLVEDSTFRRCGDGVYVRNATAPVRVLVNRCVFTNSGGNAVLAADYASVAVRECVSRRSNNHGFSASSGSLQMNVENSMATGSAQHGFGASTAIIRLSNCVATDNGIGFNSNYSGLMESFGNNKSRGNTTDISTTTPTVGTFTVVSQQ